MSDDHNRPTLGAEHDPSCPLYVEPLRFVETQDAQGRPTLDVLESSFEQSYRVGECPWHEAVHGAVPQPWAAAVSPSATARGHGLRARDPSEHNALFGAEARELDAQLHEVTPATAASSASARRSKSLQNAIDGCHQTQPFDCRPAEKCR
jgi:hypothetical protein